jgi:RNA polymerase sigma-70 factor, ECF subfamily
LPADAEAAGSEQVAEVRQALARLSSRDQQLLLLRHEGYRYREIATALGLAPGSIGTMLVRASQAFREVYYELFGASR